MEESKLDRLLRRRHNKRIALALAGLLILGLAWHLLSSRWSSEEPRGEDAQQAASERSAPPAAPQSATRESAAADPSELASVGPDEPSPTPAASQGPSLPELDASDAFVRSAAKSLANHPELARWLLTDDLVRRFAAAVDNVAEGRSPRPHLRFLAPAGPFLVLGDEEGNDPVLLDAGSYRRYDALASVVESLDAKDCARLFASLTPLLQRAYIELGYPDASFEARLKEAAFVLLSTPVVSGRPRLLPQVKRFEYEDPSLEDLSDAQKHLLRMGPRNVDRIQRKLREVLAAIDPAWTPPGRQLYRAVGDPRGG